MRSIWRSAKAAAVPTSGTDPHSLKWNWHRRRAENSYSNSVEINVFTYWHSRIIIMAPLKENFAFQEVVSAIFQRSLVPFDILSQYRYSTKYIQSYLRVVYVMEKFRLWPCMKIENCVAMKWLVCQSVQETKQSVLFVSNANIYECLFYLGFFSPIKFYLNMWNSSFQWTIMTSIFLHYTYVCISIIFLFRLW